MDSKGIDMKKIVTIIGARPQFIKAAVVSRALQNSSSISEIIVHTGQHYDANMSQVFFDELDIPAAHYQLDVGSGLQGKQTGDMLTGIESLLLKEKPDTVLIYGDTNSTLAGALAAAKLHIPIAHVEAGLRSYNRRMPEEVNRLIADQLSDILFTPTTQAINNLKQEGYTDSRIIPVGDVMYDAALFYSDKASQYSNILQILNYQPKEYILATIHRAENTNDSQRLCSIFEALERLCDIKPVIIPLHPRTNKILAQYMPTLLAHSQLHIIEPIGFLDMVKLEKEAALIITDSGGVQKEAFFYQVPCITLRDETEWVETVQLGWNQLVNPCDGDAIYERTKHALGKAGAHGHYPFGIGNAGHKIVEYLSEGNK